MFHVKRPNAVRGKAALGRFDWVFGKAGLFWNVYGESNFPIGFLFVTSRIDPGGLHDGQPLMYGVEKEPHISGSIDGNRLLLLWGGEAQLVHIPLCSRYVQMALDDMMQSGALQFRRGQAEEGSGMALCQIGLTQTFDDIFGELQQP